MAMKRRRDQKPKKSVFAGVIAAVLLTAALIFFLSQKSLQEPISVSEFKLNTVVKVTLYDSKEEPLLSQVMELCDRYEKIFSRTRKDSEIYRLNEGILPKEDGYYVLSEECAKLIEKGLYYSQLSEGAFDITIEPVSSLWDFTSEERRVPSEADLAEARKLVGYEKVELNGNKIRFAQEGMGIELGAIAKGYIADKMKTFLVIWEEIFSALEKRKMEMRFRLEFKNHLQTEMKHLRQRLLKTNRLCLPGFMNVVLKKMENVIIIF